MGGGSDTKQESTTQSQSVQQLPPWINDAAMQNYAFAQNVANRPLQQYQGQMVPDVSPQTQQAWNLAASGGNAGQDQYNASQAGYLGVMGQQPQQITAPGMAGLAPWMSPFSQSVIDKTLPIMQQQLGVQQNQLAGNAAQNNAFGGSRFGVAQGVAGAQGAQNMAQMASQLNQQNFGQASDSAMKAALANQAVQQNQGTLNLQAAQGMGALGNAAQLSQARNFATLTAAGAQEQAQQQAQINAQMQKFNQAWGYPTQQLGALQSALGMTPYGTATQSQSNAQSEQQAAANPAGMALGGMQALGSLFGAGGMFGAGGAFAPGSDSRLKTDIKRVDTHPSGLPMYAYRYKGDPKTYPKVVGPMAEHVAQIAPHAVMPVGVKGRLAINMQALPGGTPSLAAPGAMPTRGGLSPRGPSSIDTVPAMLSPGEAVLTKGAAEAMGRDRISALNAKHYARGVARVPGYAEGEAIPNQDLLADQANMAQPPAPPSMAVPQGRGPTVYDRPKTREEFYQAILPPSVPPNVKDYMYNTPVMSLARGIARVPYPGLLPPINDNAIAPAMMRPAIPGPLAAPGAMTARGGAIGALGAALRPPSPLRIRKPRMPPIRGALGG